jgi:hypothetical protein
MYVLFEVCASKIISLTKKLYLFTYRHPHSCSSSNRMLFGGAGPPSSPPSQFVVARKISCNYSGRDPLDFQGSKSKYISLNRFRSKFYSTAQKYWTVLIRGVPLYPT